MFTSGGSLVDIWCIQLFSWIMAVITGEQTLWLRCRDLNYLRCTVHWGKLRNGREYFHVFVFQNCHLFWTYDRISQLSYVYQTSFLRNTHILHLIPSMGLVYLPTWIADVLWDQCRYLYTSSSHGSVIELPPVMGIELTPTSSSTLMVEPVDPSASHGEYFSRVTKKHQDFSHSTSWTLNIWVFPTKT